MSVDVAKLLVCGHLVHELLLGLALMFELSKDLLGSGQILEVHGDLTIRLERPVEAEESLPFLILYQSAQRLKDGKDRDSLQLPGLVLVHNVD